MSTMTESKYPGEVHTHTEILTSPPTLSPSALTTRREAGGITQEIRARTVALEAGLAGEGHRQDGGGEAAATNPFPSPPAAEINGQAQAGDETTVETAQATVTALRASLASKPTAPTVATFLDTPGQEIFYRMRTNGARVADAVVLVVSGKLRVGGGEGMPLLSCSNPKSAVRRGCKL